MVATITAPFAVVVGIVTEAHGQQQGADRGYQDEDKILVTSNITGYQKPRTSDKHWSALQGVSFCPSLDKRGTSDNTVGCVLLFQRTKSRCLEFLLSDNIGRICFKCWPKRLIKGWRP